MFYMSSEEKVASLENEINSLKNQLGAVQTELSHVSCEKVALDNSYADQLRLTHNIRTQLAYAQAETAALQQRAKLWDAEKVALLKEIEAMKESVAADAA